MEAKHRGGRFAPQTHSTQRRVESAWGAVREGIGCRGSIIRWFPGAVISAREHCLASPSVRAFAQIKSVRARLAGRAAPARDRIPAHHTIFRPLPPPEVAGSTMVGKPLW